MEAVRMNESFTETQKSIGRIPGVQISYENPNIRVSKVLNTVDPRGGGASSRPAPARDIFLCTR